MAVSQRKTSSGNTAGASLRELIRKATRSPMPDVVSPMLCTLVREPFTGPQWLFEVKWDGYRLVSHIRKGKVRMLSRSGIDYTNRYPLLVSALKALSHDVVLDGEAVVFNEEGNPDFDALQLYNGHATPIAYCVFDILWLDGYDLMHLPLIERKQILQILLSGNSTIRYSEHFNDGRRLYQQMLDMNLEGLVGKKRNSAYHPGERSFDWVKLPTRKRQEFVIGGWSESDKARSFRALLFGAYHNGKLEWIGRSGGGYKEKEMPAILKKLSALEIDESPFVNKVLDTKGAKMHWVKPRLVANFEFATWTKSGRIRKPATFLGFRKDKRPEDVVREVPKEIKPNKIVAGTIAEKKDVPKKIQNKLPRAANTNWPQVESQNRKDQADFQLGDCTVELFDVDREIWKGITKADLIQYYHSVSPFLLTHVRDRPQSLNVKLHGAAGPDLYIKDMLGRQPECADIFSDKRRHKVPGKAAIIHYLVCNNEATLLWMINTGCIDVNPWTSRTGRPDHPDYITIDLDPSDDDFGKAIETAKAARQIFDKNRLTAFVKTSGKTGIHLCLPCSAFDFPQARRLSEHLCSQINALVPDITTTSVSVNSRGNRLFIDPSQNDYGDTLAAAYCVRPYTMPTVSAPLDWKEVKKGLDPKAFTIHTMEKRLARKGDLWGDITNTRVISANDKQLQRM